MKTLIALMIALSCFVSVPTRAAPVSPDGWAMLAGALIMIAVDEMRTHKLPTCEEMKKENYSAWILQHGGWGNGNLLGTNLKTCTKNQK